MDTGRAAKITVLIAEDHQLMREGTRAFLEREPDIEVVGEAANGEEAVRLARDLCPDIALVDIGMPVMNGIEATRAIRASCPRTAVLVLTMHDDAQYAVKLLEAGAAGYLLKDTGSAELVRAVRDVHAGESVLHPAIARKLLGKLLGKAAPADAKTREPLSDREIEVLQLAANGMSNKEIADRLTLSARTIQTHMSRIFDKLGVASRTEAVVFGIRKGWLRPPEPA